MAFFMGFNLTERATKVLLTIFFYRGMTAKDLAIFMTGTADYNLSQEKSTHNYLSSLIKQGLVTSYKLQATVSRGSMYYLTKKGLEVVKDILNIDEGQHGSGWLPVTDSTVFWDSPYEYYMPPLKQPAHHLMMIEFFTKLIADQEHIVRHRLNQYASKKYEYQKKQYRLRPDAEIIINDSLYTIEIDRATESHEQLVQKFETYKAYLDYCEENNYGSKLRINTIVFVVESKRREQGIRRRWGNILSAYFKGMGERAHEINLIMTTMDNVMHTIHLEQDRKQLEEAALAALVMDQKASGYKMGGSRVLSKNKQMLSAHFLHEVKESYKIMFVASTHEFESDIYFKHGVFIDSVVPSQGDVEFFIGIEGRSLEEIEKYAFYNKLQPCLPDSFDYYGVEKKKSDKLMQLKIDLATWDIS